MAKISRIKILKEIDEFIGDTGKRKFTGVEFADYLESKGIELDRSDFRRVTLFLSARLHKNKIKMIEYDDGDIYYERYVNEYEV